MQLHTRGKFVFASTLTFGLLLSAASQAQQQELPSKTTSDVKATEGKTELTDDKFMTAKKGDDDESKDATELSLSAGGLLATGNSRLFATTANGKFRYRRDDNQLSAQAAANYGRAGSPGEKVRTTVENYQATSRYDRFLGDFTLFLAVQGRRDRFRGLDLRARVDPGVGYYLINEKKAQLWVEGGYDLLYDVRREDSLTVLDSDGNPVLDSNGQPEMLDRTVTIHSARLFAGFSYAFHEALKLDLGIEYLQGLSDTDAFQVNSTAAVNAKIDDNLALSFGFTEYYDSEALPGKEELDTVTTVSIVYTLL